MGLIHHSCPGSNDLFLVLSISPLYLLYNRCSNECKLCNISDFYFKDKPWPSPEVVQGIVEEKDEASIFMILYRELYYRHIYARLKPTLEHR